MEKRVKRRWGLAALFWRYLLTTGTVMVLLAALWWGALTWLMRCGFVFSASTAATGLEVVVPALENGSLAPEQLPYYYRWAVFDESGELAALCGMDERRLARLPGAGRGVRPKGIFYSQYHRGGVADGRNGMRSSVRLLHALWHRRAGSADCPSSRLAPPYCCWPPGRSPER